MRNILIVEDQQADFKKILKCCEAAFGVNQCNFIPSSKNFSDFLGKLRISDFESLSIDYNSVKLFIIDKNLIDDDKIGIDYYDYLKRNSLLENAYIIFCSSSPPEIFPDLGEKIWYFNKSDLYTTDAFNNKLTKLLKLRYDIEDTNWVMNLNRFNSKTLTIISYFLKSCLILSLFYAVIKIITLIILLIYNSKNGIHTSTNEWHFLESIFLCLLPTFIVFGFYTYFEYNMKYFILGSRPSDFTKRNDFSKALTLTKHLFISSLISYISIKILENLNFDEFNYHKIIFELGLLIVLILFYFTLTYNNHDD